MLAVFIEQHTLACNTYSAHSHAYQLSRPTYTSP